MAINNGNGTVTVQKGDTLSAIAVKFGNGLTYQQIASMNGIANPNRIYVGQVITISQSGGGSGGGSTQTTTVNTNKPTITALAIQSNTDNTLFATWTWGKANTEKYETWWEYDTGDGVWFISKGSVDGDVKQATYSIPSNAKKVRFWVKPISEKKQGTDNTETYYWTAEWSDPKTWTDETPLKNVPAPSIEIDQLKLTLEWSDVETDSTHIEFEIYKDGGSIQFDKSPQIAITGIKKSASYSCNIEAGSKYIARCRGCKNGSYSEWSPLSEEKNAIPTTPSGFTDLRVKTKTSVYFKWEPINTAESYEIQYATKLEYFDGSDQVNSFTVEKQYSSYEKSGFESGYTYFFRIRAVGENSQYSAWSEIQSLVIGEKPSAPTTWSSTTTVIVGEPLTLYWVHNTADGSSQTQAELELIIDEVHIEPDITIKNSTDEDEKDKISKCSIDTRTGIISWTVDGKTTSQYLGCTFVEGVKIQWRVRTYGVTGEPSDWSTQRTVDVYAQPTLSLGITDMAGNTVTTLTSFPFCIKALPGPKTQTPIGYHVSIKANDSYKATDQIGIEKNINKDDEIYYKYFDISSDLTLEMTPEFIDLQNGINYTLTCTVSMDSGLTRDASRDFTVSWTDVMYTPDAEISYNEETYTTYIRPYCETHKLVGHKVTTNAKKYEVSTDTIETETVSDLFTTSGEKVFIGLNNGTVVYYAILYFDSAGNPIDPIYRKVTNTNGTYTLTSTKLYAKNISKLRTKTGEEVLIGVIDDMDVQYCMVDEAELTEDISLSVYRREFNGEFTKLSTGLNNLKSTVITDPHPALDYARYRIVAIANSTGAVSYYDVPGHPIGEIGAIIQWDEEWTVLDTPENAELSQPPWTGSLLRLPYNISVSDSNTPSVSMVEYIGRKRPVSYYGTQIGSKSTWSVVIPKSDKETLYAIRRLSEWMGDVYVREPSGTGYWANITVSYNVNFNELTIPITFNITRVEGGV